MATRGNSSRCADIPQIRVARLDDTPLSEPEYDQIEKTINDDIFFDYTDDEVYIAFDREAVRGILVAYFLDVVPAEE